MSGPGVAERTTVNYGSIGRACRLLLAAVRRRGFSIAIAAIAGAALAASPASAVAPPPASATKVAPASSDNAVPGRLIVSFAEGTSDAERAQAYAAAGGEVSDLIEAIDAAVITVPAGAEASFLGRYRSQPGVLTAERDTVVQALSDNCSGGNGGCFVPNDPYFRRDWGLQNDAFTIQPDSSADHDADIDAPYAWALTLGSTATRIAILDTGIDQNHADLAGKIVGNRNFSTSGTVDDLYGHGTLCRRRGRRAQRPPAQRQGVGGQRLGLLLGDRQRHRLGRRQRGSRDQHEPWGRGVRG